MTANEDEQAARVSGADAETLKARLQPIVVEHGWTLVWRDEALGQYWESKYEGRYDEIETLHPITDEQFQDRYGNQAS